VDNPQESPGRRGRGAFPMRRGRRSEFVLGRRGGRRRRRRGRGGGAVAFAARPTRRRTTTRWPDRDAAPD